jgi:hypothetical protein
MKILSGIIIGILIMLLIKTADAEQKMWKIESIDSGWTEAGAKSVIVRKMTDGNINCYVATGSISCVKK